MDEADRIHLGTSAFTAAGWAGTFYPPGMRPSDYLTFYAEHFDTVEVDSTFYRTPSPQTVNGWALKTPDEFIFSVKVPHVITHEKVLVDCEPELEQFVDTMDLLQEKLGPMVLQFPYFSRSVFKTGKEFLTRLKPFLNKLPKLGGYQFAVEIRNKAWLDASFADLLHEHNIALVLQDQSWMPHPNELANTFDPITGDFTYIRWLGDREGIEKITKTWDKVVEDRTNQLSGWVDVVHLAAQRGIEVYGYANNHYEGFGPATIEKFRNLWYAKGLPELHKQSRFRQEGSLFDDEAYQE